MNPALRAAWLGLTLRHGPAEMTRAVMEGVVFALRQGLDLLDSLRAPSAPGEKGRLLASGGAARHPLWLQLEADIFNRPIEVCDDAEATARGAALLAGVGCGVVSSPKDALQQAGAAPLRRIEPRAGFAALYDAAYRAWLGWAETVAARYAGGD